MSIDMNNLPLHVAITMDGNGRWATLRNHPRTFGHEEGLRTVKKIVKAASDLGIKYMTLYAFSTENWKRAESEVGFLMNLIHNHIIKELNFYTENGIRINHIGDLEKLPVMIQKDIPEAMDKTKDFTGMTVNLAINYGGRDELVRGIKKIVDDKIASDKIDEKLITKYLDMPESPDVDLLIRSGGEKRLSNFLLWESAYAELYFPQVFWPDFTPEQFDKALDVYASRQRRYGK